MTTKKEKEKKLRSNIQEKREEWFSSEEEKIWTKREIDKMHCASHLVETSIDISYQIPDKFEDEFNLENISNLYQLSEDAPTFTEWLEGCDYDVSEAKKNEDSDWWPTYQSEMLDFEEMQDIFEWWIVDKWIADRLKEIDEPILNARGLYFWGRTCTGQAIELDGTIQEVYRNLQEEINRDCNDVA